MGKLNLNLTLPTLRITPELNTSYKDLSFPQGESIQNDYLENVPLQNVMVAKTKIQAESLAEQLQKQLLKPLQKQPQLLSLDPKDPSEKVDFKKK